MRHLTLRSLILAASTTTLLSYSAGAQNEQDALRYSFLQPQGTARSIGFGSALGSIGGEFSSLAVNPAGIGIYRSSEIMITPSLTFAGTSSDYSGNSSHESGSHFAFSNIGIVSTKSDRGRRRKSNGWTSFSFGFGLTRVADFTRDYSYQGNNNTSSASFVFENDANKFGISTDGSITSLADLGYQSFLLDTFGTGYISVVDPGRFPVRQGLVMRERGGISELGLTLGGSYQDKLMIGATLGIPVLRYLMDKTLDERDISGNNNNDFDNFHYTDNLKTSGAGINLKLGFIYKATTNFRFGAAIHTPTAYSLTDIDNQAITTNTENFGGTVHVSALENQYDYNLTTPWRGVVSATALFGKMGFFTVDYEYVDYASARFRFGSSADEKDYQSFINNQIKATYQGASNIRTGIEIRLDNLMIRGGFGYYGNPYKSGNPSAERLDFSAGLGFRFESTFLDFGFVHHQYKLSEQPYTLPASYAVSIPTATLTTGANNAVVTFGVKL